MPDAPPVYRGPWLPHRKAAKRAHDKRRGSSVARGYGYRWQQIRQHTLAAEPLCRRCNRAGKVTVAEMVHHITPIRDGGTHEADNLMPLCNACHDLVHTEMGRGGSNL